MIAERRNRCLPNRFLNDFMGAVENEVGAYSLNMVLHQAGLARYAESWPQDNMKEEALASDYASIQLFFREYYGTGARGSLNRIGRKMWETTLNRTPLTALIRGYLARFLTHQARVEKALRIFENRLSKVGVDMSVHQMDMDWIMVDRTSDTTYGQNTQEPICWVTLGMVQGALHWMCNQEFDVEETTCRAMGDPVCSFIIRM